MDILSRPPLPADHRIPYGKDSSQFGDLWLPAPSKSNRAPLVVFFHGGWWKSAYDLQYTSHLCAALKKAGIACWSIEYRRVGATGGGWPTTFQDAAAGFDHVASLAETYPLDLSRVVVMGHSAGGHLAFWVAGRHHLDPGSELNQQAPKVPLTGAIALAGAVDLRLTIDLSGYFTFAHDKHEVFALMGGRPVDVPKRYSAGNPGDLLPFHIPQVAIQGTADDQIPPELPSRWVQVAKQHGDVATLIMIPDADHFDIVDPDHPAWQIVMKSLIGIIGR